VKRIQREFEVCLAKKVKSIEPFQDIWIFCLCHSYNIQWQKLGKVSY
jgi:hypothetical protein